MSNDTEFTKFLEMIGSMNITVDPNSYIYFSDETGIIDKISNVKEDVETLSILQVPHKEVEAILSGEKSSLDFRVVYDIEKKAYLLKETKLSQEMFNPELSKLIKINTVEEADINIYQDKVKKEWKIRTSGSFKNFLQKDPQLHNKSIFFSITSENDPNILYRYMSCSLSDLATRTLYISFESETEENALSVFTTNYFDSYNYEVIE